MTAVRSSSRKWRPICHVSANVTLRFFVEWKLLKTGELRFERGQVLIWMDAFVAMGKVQRRSAAPRDRRVLQASSISWQKKNDRALRRCAVET